MNIYILIILIAIIAFLPRYLPWVICPKASLPIRIQEMLKTAPIAIISALIVPEVIYQKGDFSVYTLLSPYFISSIITFIIMLLSKRLVLSSLLGIATFFILKIFI